MKKKIIVLLAANIKKLKTLSYIFQKNISFSVIFSNCGSKNEKIFKEEAPIVILRILDFIFNYQYTKIDMTEENIGQEFRLKEIDEKLNYFIQEMKQNELISKKHKKVCKILNYTQDLLVLATTVTGCDVFQFLLLLLYLVFQ